MLVHYNGCQYNPFRGLHGRLRCLSCLSLSDPLTAWLVSNPPPTVCSLLPLLQKVYKWQAVSTVWTHYCLNGMFERKTLGADERLTLHHWHRSSRNCTHTAQQVKLAEWSHCCVALLGSHVHYLGLQDQALVGPYRVKQCSAVCYTIEMTVQVFGRTPTPQRRPLGH